MDLEKLREIQSKERQSDSLQELSDTFYSDASDYIEEMHERRDEIDDPFSDEAQRVNDAVKTAQDIGEAIYERRVGKVVKLASLSANGVNVDESGMTREEREMYENIVEEIRTQYDFVVEDVLKGKDGNEQRTRESDEGETLEATQESEDDTGDYTTVRVTESLPGFMGVDGKEYELGEEDVAVIPDENAEALCEKDAAIKLDPA